MPRNIYLFMRLAKPVMISIVSFCFTCFFKFNLLYVYECEVDI